MPDATPARDVDPSLTSFVDIVSWGDTSLGCPQPGVRYAQVVTDGTKIVLEHGATTHDHHSGGDRPDPFLCARPEAPVQEGSPRIDRTLDTEGG